MDHKKHKMSPKQQGGERAGGIKCLQLNLGRGRAATNVLLKIMEDEEADITFIQEPYMRGGKIAGLGNRTALYGGENPKTAVIINKGRVDACMDAAWSNDYCTAVEVRVGGHSWMVASIYIPPVESRGVDFHRLLGHVRDLCNTFRGNRELIVAGDFNSKSQAWGSSTDDWRGREVLSMVEDCELVITNSGGEPTFEGPRGVSHVDLTLSTVRTHNRISGWRIGKEETASDHRLIVWTIDAQADRPRTAGFCTKKADWGIFQTKIEESVRHIEKECAECNSQDAVDKIFDEIAWVIAEACSASMPLWRRFGNSVPWWTPELTELRRRARGQRRRFQRARNAEERETEKQEYSLLQCRYRRRMREVRLEEWAKFCEESTKDNPWGAVYRTIRGRKPGGLACTLRDGDGGAFTTDASATCDLVMRRFFPNDPVEDDDAGHRRTREMADSYRGSGVADRPFTATELTRAIHSMGKKKAPGIDGITAEVVTATYDIMPGVILRAFNCCLDWGRFPSAFKLADVRLVPKVGGGRPDELSTYRPISLLPAMGKVLDALLIGRIEHHVGPGHPQTVWIQQGEGHIGCN